MENLFENNLKKDEQMKASQIAQDGEKSKQVVDRFSHREQIKTPSG